MSFRRVVMMSDAISRGRLPGGDILQEAARDVLSSLSARQSLELFKLLSGFIVSCCKSSRFNERAAPMKTTSSQCSFNAETLPDLFYSESTVARMLFSKY